jgi:GH24 family phage-related lysozyme (muramidase)
MLSPQGARSGIATAAAAAAGATAMAGGCSHLPSDCVVRVDEMLPPEFQRHCAAVASWGPNVGTITELVQTAVQTLHARDMLGSADKLLSWQAGKGVAECWQLQLKQCRGSIAYPKIVFLCQSTSAVIAMRL